MLWLNSDSPILDHEAKVVESDPNDEDRDIVSDGASLKQVYCEEKRVVVLA